MLKARTIKAIAWGIGTFFVACGTYAMADTLHQQAVHGVENAMIALVVATAVAATYALVVGR